MNKRLKLFLELSYGITWRTIILMFAFIGLVDWFFTVFK